MYLNNLSEINLNNFFTFAGHRRDSIYVMAHEAFFSMIFEFTFSERHTLLHITANCDIEQYANI